MIHTHNQQEYGPRELFGSYLDRVGGERLEGRGDVRLLDGSQSISHDILDWETRHGTLVRYTNADILHSILPSAKIIMILRDPVDRLYSDYFYFNSVQYYTDSHYTCTPELFHSEVEKEIGKWDVCMRESKSLQKCCYSSELMDPQAKIRLPLSVYICFVKPWLELFGSNFHLVSLEKYTTKQAETLLEIFRFLDLPLPSISTIENILSEGDVHNKGESYAPMLRKTRELLTAFYRPYNEMLYGLTGEPAFLFEK